jgi:lipid II isoglutaminyl synthase (glutamine-hydrolysing)
VKLNIGYFYPKLLNLYGDNGNVEILVSRARSRGITVEVFAIGIDSKIDSNKLSDLNLVFMGGGPDSAQKSMYSDLIENKGAYLRDYIESYGVGLYICGSYQLLGNYYEAANGDRLEGLGVFDMYTRHFGNHKPRCIGNVLCNVCEKVLGRTEFKSVNNVGETLVGFENHGGRTYLSSEMRPFANIQKGYGNNGEDSTEGILYKSSIGTYLHGPLLARNPHLADYLIATALNVTALEPLDDSLIIAAHTASKTLT